MTSRAAALLLGGFPVGAVMAAVGIAITRQNEQAFGAGYLQYRLEWLALPSLPGFLAAESGPDWQFGEWWFHRYEIIAWNFVIWGFAWFAVAVMPSTANFLRRLFRTR